MDPSKTLVKLLPLPAQEVFGSKNSFIEHLCCLKCKKELLIFSLFHLDDVKSCLVYMTSAKELTEDGQIALQRVLPICRIDVDPDSLRWTPVLSGPASLYGSPYKRDCGTFFMGRSPPIRLSHEKRAHNVRKSSSSEEEEEEEEQIEEEIAKSSSKKKRLESVKKNLAANLKRAEEKSKKGRKKKSGDEAATVSSTSDEKNCSASDDNDEDDDNNIDNVKVQNNFGRKNSVTKNLNKRSLKRSGEFEGLAGGAKTNIFASTTTSSRRQPIDGVAKKIVADDISTKSKIVGSVKNSPAQPKDSGILNRAIGRLLEQQRREDGDDDADVEDEVDDKTSLMTVNGKANTGSLEFESPTKKLKKRSPDLTNRRLKRAAASKASDRIARESRGSINLDSSSSSDSDVSSKNSKKSKNPSKLDIFSKKSFDRPKIIEVSDSSDFEDENVTLASKFKKNLVGKRKSIDSTVKKVENNRKKEEETSIKNIKDNSDVVVANSKQVKQNQDQEKENHVNRSSDQPVAAPTTNGKNLSWPEQLARSKAARSVSTEKRRTTSIDDSPDSADTAEPPRSLPALVEPKKAIVLPILGKHHKEAMLRAAAAAKDESPTPAPKTSEANSKKRKPGRPKKSAVHSGG